MAKKENKYGLIREELLDQLHSKGKYGNYYEDLITHVVYYFKLKDDLQYDIENRGIRIVLKTGNGFEKEAPNESVRNLNQVSANLMKLLSQLGLDAPEIVDEIDTL